jgi:hypothetical protein
MITLLKKDKSIEILSNYLRKIKINEIPYYIDKPKNLLKNLSIPKFLEENTYEPEDIELFNFFLEHLNIGLKKLFMNHKLFDKNILKLKINLSFVTNRIYWDELFVIENTLFISNQYLIKILEKIEYKEYNKVSELYFDGEEIFDLELLEKILNCLISIVQFINYDYYEKYILDKYNCFFIEKTIIKFKNNYKILSQPNMSFIFDKITVYPCEEDNIFYGVFDSICSSDMLFCPYWNTQIIKLKFTNGFYEEITLSDNNIELDENKLIPNPFENIINQFVKKIL